MEEESILGEADALVNTDRQAVYGHPLDDFSRAAQIWSAILDCDVNAEQVALCMIGVKMSRLCNSPDHRDTLIDIAGYAKAYHLVREERRKRSD